MNNLSTKINDLLSIQGLDLSKDILDHNTLSNLLIECRDEIERLTEKCDRQAMILRRLTPENFPNTYFICGEAGAKDTNGLPETILVVPAYGVDWNMTYTRTGKTFGPEW